MDKLYIVYAHISPSDKIYIGITSQSLNIRCGAKGQKYKSLYFSNAIKKYGWSNFKHIVLLEDLTIEQAKLIEIFLIDKYKSDNRKNGYNITKGGDPCNKGLSQEERDFRKKESIRIWGINNHEKRLEYQRKFEKTHNEERKKRQNELNKEEKGVIIEQNI